MQLIECRSCGQPVVAGWSGCPHCGRSVVHAAGAEPTGLGMVAQLVVIGAVFAVVLLGMVVLTERQHAVDAFAVASAQAVAEAEEEADAARPAAGTVAPATPTPALPDAGGPDTYTVQAGDSLFSVAADLGLSANELVFWNRDRYPTLQSTPALTAGWVLRTAGPALATPLPRPTSPPGPTAVPDPQVAGPGSPVLPAFGPGSFPASDAVTVTTYSVTGSTPREIAASQEVNGPWSEWIGARADAYVEVMSSFNFRFRGDGAGGCSVESTGAAPVTVTYHVVIPAWTPPSGVSSNTVDWWIETIHDTVAHEGHHITLYESFLPAMNEAVASGTCASVEATLEQLWTDARRANCEFDLAEYGSAAGLTLESCLAE